MPGDSAAFLTVVVTVTVPPRAARAGPVNRETWRSGRITLTVLMATRPLAAASSLAPSSGIVLPGSATAESDAGPCAKSAGTLTASVVARLAPVARAGISLNPSSTPAPGAGSTPSAMNTLTRNLPTGAVPALRTVNDAVI